MELGVSTKKLGDGTSRLDRPGVASANGHYVVFSLAELFPSDCARLQTAGSMQPSALSQNKMWSHVTKITARRALISAQ